MLRKSVRKLLMLILAVIIGIMLLRWLQQQQPVASQEPAWQLTARVGLKD